MKSINIKVLKTIPDYAIDQVVNVKTDAKGTPLLKFWRDRLQDSKVDGCVEVVKTQTQTKTKPSTKGDS